VSATKKPYFVVFGRFARGLINVVLIEQSLQMKRAAAIEYYQHSPAHGPVERLFPTGSH